MNFLLFRQVSTCGKHIKKYMTLSSKLEMLFVAVGLRRLIFIFAVLLYIFNCPINCVFVLLKRDFFGALIWICGNVGREMWYLWCKLF